MTIGCAARLRMSSFRFFKQKSFLSVTCVVALFTAGCASTPRYFRSYDGPALESNKVAILKIHQYRWRGAMVDVIDGVPIRKTKRPEFNNTETIELLPGRHQLEISYMDTNGYSTSPAILSFTSERNHVYELFAAPEKRTSGQVLGAMFFGGKYHWTVWISDCGNNEVVAGEKWEDPSRQFK